MVIKKTEITTELSFNGDDVEKNSTEEVISVSEVPVDQSEKNFTEIFNDVGSNPVGSSDEQNIEEVDFVDNRTGAGILSSEERNMIGKNLEDYNWTLNYILVCLACSFILVLMFGMAYQSCAEKESKIVNDQIFDELANKLKKSEQKVTVFSRAVKSMARNEELAERLADLNNEENAFHRDVDTRLRAQSFTSSRQNFFHKPRFCI